MKMRKVLSLILCLCMVFVLLPSAAIAADSEGEFKEEGGELYFYQSLDFTRTDTYGNEWSYTMKYKLDSTTQTATCMGVNGAVNVFTGGRGTEDSGYDHLSGCRIHGNGSGRICVSI
ncbi:MAG: hypothetical protein ACLR23_18535 [Clostridia bacterium]